MGLRAALGRRDAETIGRAYSTALKQRLEEIGEWERSGRSYDLFDDPVRDWLDLVWWGEDPDTGAPIDAELWFELVVAAADSVGNDGGIWCVGDGPADQLVGDHPEMGLRLHAARLAHPGVATMFEVMIESCRLEGNAATWWSDPTVLLRPGNE